VQPKTADSVFAELTQRNLPKRKLLLVSYLFPPGGGIGVQRALSLAKYLPRCGFEVHVLTARNAAAPVYDANLLKQVPSDTRIHSAFTPELPFALRQTVWSWLTGRKRKARVAPEPGVRENVAGSAWKRILTKLVRRMLCPEPEVLWLCTARRAPNRSKLPD
jgi:hypothetical protein